MKQFLTLIFAFITTMSINAQGIDTSNWKVGDNIAGDLNWGDYDGTFSGGKTANTNGDYTPDDIGNWWKGTKPAEYNIVDGVGAYGFYASGASLGDLANVYQVVYFPAGYYTVQVQALYREGTPVDNFTNHFSNIKKKNAWLYADALTGEDPQSEVTRSFTKYVRSLATSGQTDSLYFNSSGSWKNDYSYDYINPQTSDTTTYWCPSCLPGAIEYFKNGNYENTMDIVLTHDTYVRLGFRKTANIAQDWLVFTNFRVIYNGPADDAAQLTIALSDYDVAYANVEEIRDNINNKGYGALASIIDDQIMDIDDNADKSVLAGVLAATTKMSDLYDAANNTLHVAYSLADLIGMTEDIITSTDFSGKSEFQTIFDGIKEKANATDPAEINNDITTYSTLFTELSAARANYLNTGATDANGAKDFTSLIKFPWFVNPEYNPTYSNGVWQLTAKGWVDGTGPDSYTKKKSGKLDIASKVVLSADETVTNQWYKYVNYTAGWSGGLNLFYQGHLVGVSDGWNSGLTGTIEIRQQLVGLPNGYYSVKALVRGNGSGDWKESNLPPYHNIFAKNTAEVVVASPAGHTDSYVFSQWGWNEWNPAAWQEHKTGIIQVPDGRLLIGGQTSMVGNFTGFRLSFYGENPAFDDMIQEEIGIVNNLLTEKKVTFAGDTLYIDSLINTIKIPLASVTAYEAAFANTTKAKAYIQAAGNVMTSYTTPADYTTLAGTYDAATAQAQILAPAVAFINKLGTDKNDKYTLVADAKTIYTAYKNYLTYYDKAAAYNTNNVNIVLAEQAAVLKAGYSNATTLNQYATALCLLVNTAAINAAGGETASVANPANITSLIVNPNFTSDAKTGWSGTGASTNEYARGNAEIWNTSSIDVYQTIKGLPEGKYEVRVRALYRDNGNVSNNSNQSWTSWWTDANGDVNTWARHYAKLYAKTATVDTTAYIKSICDGKFTTPSFHRYAKSVIEGDAILDENGNIVKDANGKEMYETDTVWMYFTDTTYVAGSTTEIDTVKLHGYPFDETIKVEEGTYYYPASMFGAYNRFLLSPESYNNKVQIDLANGDDLTIGMRKSQSVSGDWLIYDDFELYYLGSNIPVAIQDINKETNTNSAIYNVAGQRVSNMTKGIYIKNGKKYLIK